MDGLPARDLAAAPVVVSYPDKAGRGGGANQQERWDV
jgi:hypothetical protein